MKAHMSTEGLREALRTTVIDLVLSKVDSPQLFLVLDSL